MTFDPNAAAAPGSGIFGLPHSRKEARIVLIPVPFDATTSYGGGASSGPEAILAASAQVDLLDHQFGRIYEAGISMADPDSQIAETGDLARRLAEPIIAKGGAAKSDAETIARIDEAGAKVNRFTHGAFSALLREGKIPGLVGGDHSTPFGAIQACAGHVATLPNGAGGLGILQVDAHMDLREAYEGFAWSHASIMWNALERIEGVRRLVQVGIRDYCEAERDYAAAQRGRVVTHYDFDWFTRLAHGAGASLLDLCREAVDSLPRHVYISFDIDALDPALCPHTGTPVPGGLSFNAAAALLGAVVESGRTVVGFDLNEVSQGPDGDEWDANVGARVLYKLCGAALRSQPREA
jgi:agmatinase